jgi:antirestriction protein
MRDVSNSDDIIDSRDVISRIDDLRTDLRLDEVEDAREAVEEAKGELEAAEDDADRDTAQQALDAAEAELAEVLAASEGDEHEDDRNELAALEALAKEGEDYAADWSHGESLIRESYFVQYAEELANDIGAVKSDAGWPNGFIDWEKAADALKIDYSEVDFDGVTYLIR